MPPIDAPTASGASWRTGYIPGPDAFDEWFAADGQPRAHLQALVARLDDLGADGLTARHEAARRALRENGVTYNVYGDPDGVDRVMRFDPLPLVISNAEWRALEAGLLQRTRLLNTLLADLYGPQRALVEGVLPASVVHGCAGFLPPCQGLRPPQDLWLHLHAVDLARSPDGNWWALADRAQAPSGAGYALESRMVLSRLLPEEMRRLGVRRLAGFFREWRQGLAAASGAEADPRIVILTPGPLNETYFEHAFLSRYLGFPLVQGDDLTVRGNRVFLKTVEGLQPVHTILRRVDDGFCDPLELRSDSFLGVAGLLEAARNGGVVLANGIGSGIAESPALLAFLPTLCRFFLGEDLLLPSVATWWCGQPCECAEVLAALDRMVIKDARAGIPREPVYGADLDEAARAEWLGRILREPYAYIGQEAVASSGAPVWRDGALEHRQVGLRAFIARGREDWMVMPGGLTRVSPMAGSRVVSMQSGGAGKDAWVLSDAPVWHDTLIPPVRLPSAHARAEPGLPSRVADHLYWLGRYAERLEHLARLLRAVLVRLGGDGFSEPFTDPLALAALLGPVRLHPGLMVAGQTDALHDWIVTVARETNRPGGLRDGLLQVRQAAWMVRERLSGDTWRILGDLHTLGATASPDVSALLDRVILYLGAFSGMEMEDMVRDYGWRFLDMGRRLERAGGLLQALGVAMGSTASGPVLLEPLLDIADSTITYRRRYFASAQPEPTLDLLLLDDTNPRSVTFQLQRLTEHVDALRRLPDPGAAVELRGLLAALIATLRTVDPARAATAEGRIALVTDGAALVERLRRFSDLVSLSFFAHAGLTAR